MSLPLLWNPQEKIKRWFIQEPWIYFLAMSRNSQIFFITNIMTFRKFAQEIYFYWLVASLYLINHSRSKSKIFSHSFISCRLPHVLMNDFKWSSSEENIMEICIFEFNYFFGNSSPMLKSCWIHSKNSNFFFYCSPWWNTVWSETYKTVQNPEPVIRRCSKFTEIHLCWSLFSIRLQMNFDKILCPTFLQNTYRDSFWKWETFFRSKLIIKVVNSFLVSYCIVKWPKRH